MWSRRAVLAAASAAVLPRTGRAADFTAALAQGYGSPVDPQAGFALAQAEVRRLQARAERLLRGQGLVRGSVGGRLRTLAGDARWLYPDDEDGRRRAVGDMNARLTRIAPELSRWFADPVPQAQVRRPAPADEARGGYREPPVYYVDLRNIRSRPMWTLPTVAFHETIPGHALQSAVTGRPRPPCFPEAWAVYAEQLASDIGQHHNDPLDELGYLHWRLFRMGRVLADIGQGVLGWSADEAVATMRAAQGFDAAFVTMEADAARMRSQPGVYSAQGLAALAIAAARPRKAVLWRSFHRAILADAAWASAIVPARDRSRR